MLKIEQLKISQLKTYIYQMVVNSNNKINSHKEKAVL